MLYFSYSFTIRMDSNRNMLPAQSILWRSFVFAGHEACRLFARDSQWHLEGTAVFSHQQQPCRLDYQIVCDAVWRTLTAKVEGWLGNVSIDTQIRSDANGRWWLNEVEQPEVMGCIDIDLNFSPSTNLLPIRRLGLVTGQTAELNAAWLRFPGFRLEPLAQQYRRLDERTYRYESGNGRFVAELKVDRAGFVVDYPGLWKAETVE